MTTKFKPKLGELLGEGEQKKVHAGLENPDRVYGVYKPHEKESVEYIKAEYYLLKILHLLFPGNIPDAFLSTTEPRVIARERIYFGDSPEKPQDNFQFRQFANDMLTLGIFLDPDLKNVRPDQVGNMVYFDELWPWIGQGIGKEKGYDAERLKEYILERLTGHEQKTALSYLERLETAYRQNLESLEKETG